MTILGVTLSTQERNLYNSDLRTNLIQQARLIAGQAMPLIKANPSNPEINDLAKQAAALISARVTIILPNGIVVGESNYDLTQMENHLQRPEVQLALKSQEAVDTRYSVTLKANYLYAAVPIKDGATILGISRVSVSTAKIDSDVMNIEKLIFISALAMAAIALAITLLISYITLKPLRDLTRFADKLAYPQSKEGIASRYRDEIHQLEFSINQMANELTQQISSFKAESGRLSAVLTSMTDGILLVDKVGTVKMINPSARVLFSIYPEKNEGMSLVEAVENFQIVDLWKKTFNEKSQQATAIEFGPDRIYIQVVATPLEGQNQGDILLTFQNLTRVRRLEMVRQDFVSNVSHELRTPLTSLKALTETLKDGALQDPPAAQKFLVQMDQEIDNLIQMVEELLELSRIESGKVPLFQERISPEKLVEPAIERMQLQIERARLNLAINFAEDLPQVNADPQRIQQVVINLIHNAVKFTPPSGTISIGASRESGNVVFYVQDTGKGIAPGDLERIFERFYKTDRSRASRGTGLGLSIARHIIESHSGRIWAESNLGQGSTFYFSLPAV